MPTRDSHGLDPEHLWLLRAARESGILGALLDSAGTPADVAAEADVTDHAARVTVEALADLGFLERVGGEYEITNRALGFLAKRDIRSIGRLPHALDVLDLCAALPETMATGEAPAKPPNWTRNRLGAHAATDAATVRACVTAVVREATGAETVLDVAGGSGVFAREFAARGLDVTLADEAAVVDAVAPLLAPTSVSVVEAALPTLPDSPDPDAESDQFDLVSGVDTMQSRSAETNAALVASAADVAGDGGSVAFVDVLRDRSDAAVTVATHALATGDGDAYAEETVREWFDDAGLSDVVVRDVPGTDRQVVAGHKHTVQEA